ncbi:filamentous hemagglutinin N-terminal domain-containing protein [Kovacikia minuta CCNUW1]|uniref:two-partner secretion domain-containing protein n=1 Tax=Kovacikia minuta TaxID=2931930 RepID=UPI001CCAC6F0|nr:filamentous hemagglutinin N-terminal domain-containing protein [Kovacikia minuta]UBF29000.1 filamentous hemagglutinin N-terminal domain-containing protein [Kovacikia minuta CCNUW1]
MKLAPGIIPSLLAAVALIPLGHLPATAQITGAADGTHTLVNQNGNTFNITGGTQAGANLFHSFQQFGLNQGQIASFLSNPSIQNILGRVTGGEASLINGLIRVTGGASNLYLMNPAGIVFGASASLNVPGSFLATTANAIGFDRPIPGSAGGWFNATGSNDYAALASAPTSLAFTALQPAAIVNSANLAVSQGQNLALIGGTVTSTGQLSAPGGAVTVASVPGESLVRISAAGQILGIEIRPTAVTDSAATGSQPTLSLAELLTGGNSDNATGLTVNPDGTVTLTGSGLQVNQGDVVVKAVSAQTATLSANHNLTLVESQIQTTGDLSLLAQNKVQVRDSVTSPVLVQAGGNLQVQGNQGIDILALNHPQPAFQSGGKLSLVSDGVISGDSHFASGGGFSILNLAGQAGQFTSLYDPIISVNGNVTFGSYTGAALKVEATGSIAVTGDITINAPDATLAVVPGNSDRQLLRTLPALILRAGLTTLQESTSVANPSTNPPFSFNEPGSGTTFNASAASTPRQIVVDGNITTTPATGSAGPVILAAPGGITVTGNINTSATDTTSQANGGQVNLATTTGSIQVGNIQATGAGAFNVGFGQNGSVLFTSNTGNITASGEINGVNTVQFATGGNITARTITANTINLTSTGGSVTVGDAADPTVNSLSTSTSDNTTSIRVSARNTIQALGPINGYVVNLDSTAGDVIIQSILSGAGGVDISAAGLFQARGTRDLSNVFLQPLLSEAPDLLSFLQAKGIIVKPDQRVTIGFGDNTALPNGDGLPPGIPYSINARQTSTIPAGTLNAPITIRFGGATRTLVDRQFVIPGQFGDPDTTSRILIQGGNGAFYSGPTVTGRLVPNISDPFVTVDAAGNFVAVSPSTFTPGVSTLFRNELYSTAFPSSQFPDTISGTVGAIIVGFGSNQTLFGAVQNQPFNAINPGTGNPGGGNSGGGVSGSGSSGGLTEGGTRGGISSTGVTGDAAQTVQRQLNSQNQGTACPPSRTIAAVPNESDQSIRNSPGTSGTTNNPCTSTGNDEAQILTILDETPNPNQR